MARPLPAGRTLSAVRAVAPLAVPLGAAALALFLLGRLLNTLPSDAPSSLNRGPSTTSVATALAISLGPSTPAPSADDPLQLTPHPALDRSRPLGYFGDAAP